MSAVGALRLGLTDLFAGLSTLSATQVLAIPPGENEALKESVWVGRTDTGFEWRSLGAGQDLAVENIDVEVHVRCYGEGPDQLEVSETVLSRFEAIVTAISHAVHAEPSVGGAVSWCRVARVSCTPVPAPSGWIADGVLSLSAVNHP